MTDEDMYEPGSQYDRMQPIDIVYDFAVIRGDLTEGYARAALADVIDRRTLIAERAATTYMEFAEKAEAQLRAAETMAVALKKMRDELEVHGHAAVPGRAGIYLAVSADITTILKAYKVASPPAS